MVNLRNFLLSLVFSLIIFGITAYFIVGFVNSSMNEVISGSDKDSSSTQDPTDSSNNNTPGNIDTDNSPSSMNVLFVGLDSGLSQMEGEQEADTIVLVNVNRDKKRFMFTSIPCDTRVDFKGYTWRLGMIYNEYGIDGVIEAVKALTGIKTDFYVVMDYDGLAEVYKLLGDITYDVPMDMYYEPASDILSDNNGEKAGPEIDLKAGRQKLSAEQVLMLLRYKGYSNGDADRMTVQRNFINEIFKQKLNVTLLPKAGELFGKIRDVVTTNMSSSQFVIYVDLIFSYGSYKPLDLVYPGSYIFENGTTFFQPNIQTAISRYMEYR